MQLQTESAEERLALLLGLLEPDVVDPILERLPQDKGQRLRGLVVEIKNAPVDKAEILETIDEFMRFFQFAMSHLDNHDQGEAQDGHDVEEYVEEPKKAFVSSGDPFVDLKRLSSTQIAGALRNEQPRTIAVVLNCLEPKKTGEVIRHLAEEIRNAVFLQLRNPPTAQQALLERVVSTTVEKGCRLDAESATDPEEQINQKLADVLRHIDQQQRAEMLRALSEQDEDLANHIKGMLYLFEDVGKLTDRCVQKLLGEIQTAVLCRSLKDADDAITDNIMNNLSKRAKTTLAEELEYLNDVKPIEVEQARNEICEVLARLDESGDLEIR